MQITPGSSERSRQSSGQLRSLGGKDELAQLSSPNNLQSATDATLDLLDKSGQPSKSSLGVKSEQVETLSVTSPPFNQSTTNAGLDLLDQSEELPLKQQQSTVEALSIASPSNLPSTFLDPSEELSLTLQQREAISRQYHFKFITGHYGSGKVRVILEIGSSWIYVDQPYK